MKDVIIIGAGPAGLSCQVMEKGCIVNSLYHFPENLEIGGGCGSREQQRGKAMDRQ